MGSVAGIAALERKPIRKTVGYMPEMEIDFEKLVRENTRGLFNTAFHMLGNSEEAEDAVQEIFLEAYRALPGYKGISSAKNWLYRIAMNVLADIINAKKRRPVVAEGIDPDSRAGYAPDTRAAGSAESEYLKVAEQKMIRDAVLKLPVKYRAVFVLNVVEGYSHNEIAETLGISPGAARVIRLRAAKMIRNEMSKRGFGERESGDELQTK